MIARHKILTTSLVASSLLLVPGMAFALNTITTNQTDQAIKTSTGPDDIAVNAGVIITDKTAPAINMNAVGKSVTNSGTLSGTNRNGILVSANSDIINNTIEGNINSTGPFSAVYINGGAITNILRNQGMIEHNDESTKFAIEIANDFSDLIIHGLSTIQNTHVNGTAIAITGAETGNIYNSGTIRGGAVGLSVRSNLTGYVSNGADIISTNPTGSAVEIKGDIIGAPGARNGGFLSYGLIDGGAGSAIQVTAPFPSLTTISNSGRILGNVILNGNTLNLEMGFTHFGSSLTGNISGAGTEVINIRSVNERSYTLEGLGIKSGGLIDKVGTVDIKEGVVDWNHKIGSITPIKKLTISAGILNLGADVASASLENNGTGVLALANSINQTGDFIQQSGTLQVTLTDKNNYGQLKVSGNIDMTNGGTINVVAPAATSRNIKSGDFFDVVTVGGTVVTDAAKLTGKTLLLNFTKGLAPNGKDIRITANRQVVIPDDSTGIGSTLTALMNATPVSAAYNDAFTQLEAITDPIQFNNAVRSLGQDNSGSLQSTAVWTTNFTNELVAVVPIPSSRIQAPELDVSQSDQDNSGYAAGSSVNKNNGMWMQGFGNFAHQKMRKKIPGYASDTMGFALGLDSHFEQNFALGVAGTYSFTNSNTQNIARNNSKVRSYIGTLYGSMDLKKSYIDAAVSYGRSDFETIRNIAIGALVNRALADFSGNQYGGRIAYNLPKISDDMMVVNSFFVSYIHATQDAYTERNAGGLGLIVQKQRNDVLDIGIGTQFSYPIKTEYGEFIPHFAASVAQDIIGKTPYSIASFVGGSPSFRTNGAPVAKTTIDLATGFNVVLNQRLNFNVNYDVAFKKNFIGQSGTLTARYTF